MSNKLHYFSWFIMCIIATSNCFGVVFRLYDFPELVNDAPVIAVGKIAIEGGHTMLFVRERLKGHIPFDKIGIDTVTMGDVPTVQFANGEDVLVFLHQISADGRSRLFGGGDQGKWPRASTSSGFPPVLNRASIEDVGGIVRGLMQVNETVGVEAKAEHIRSWLRSSDKARQLVAIQYISNELFWLRDRHSGKLSASHRERRDILNGFVGDISEVIQSDDTWIRWSAVRALRFADPDLAKPLIEFIASDTNESVRAAVREVESNQKGPVDNQEQTEADNGTR